MYQTIKMVKKPLEPEHVQELPPEILGLFIDGKPVCRKDLTRAQKESEGPTILIPGEHRCTKCKRIIR